MVLIIGGAYQGKLDYAKKEFGLTDTDVYDCSVNSPLDPCKSCYNHFERYVMYCMRNGVSINYDHFKEKVIILTDIFCGVVPQDSEIRAWREECGRVGTKLAGSASIVIRIFCGLAKRLK